MNALPIRILGVAANIVITLLVIIEFWITAYKFPLSFHDVYHIFPHSENPTISNSPRAFLSTHILLALILIFVTCLRLLSRYLPATPQNKIRADKLASLHAAAHILFVLFIFLNCWNLGPLSWYQAMIVNLLGIILTSILLEWNYLRLYFVVLSVPALVEIIILYQRFTDCVVNHFNQNFYDHVWHSLGCPFIPPHH